LLTKISLFNLLYNYPILLKSPHCIIKAKWVFLIYFAGWSRTEKLNQHPSGDPVVWRVRRGEGVPIHQHPVPIAGRMDAAGYQFHGAGIRCLLVESTTHFSIKRSQHPFDYYDALAHLSSHASKEILAIDWQGLVLR
jgi:hypothetical protein